MSDSEKKILNDTLVKVSALPETFIWRNNTGTAWQGEEVATYPGTSIPVPPGVKVLVNARPVSFGLPGSPDIIGTSRGRAIGIEIKAALGRQSTVQRNFERAWRAAGGEYILDRDAEAIRRRLLK